MNKFSRCKTKEALVFVYAHLPEKIMFLAYPPKDITINKYNDKKYLLRVSEMVSELEDKDFREREDGVFPYSRSIIIKHIQNRLKELSKK